MTSENKSFLDAFYSPADEYGEVPFYWWCGDKLDKKRIADQLKSLKEKGIAGVQINYAHEYSNLSGIQYGGHGKSIDGDPKQFSEKWWEFFAFAAKECEKLGMGIGVGDYTLAWIGNGFFTDTLANSPDMNAENLLCTKIKESDFNKNLLSGTTLAIIGFEDTEYENPVIIYEKNKGFLADTTRFQTLFIVESKLKPLSISPLNPDCGKMLVDIYFAEFERRLPELKQGTLNYFFQDELLFNTDIRTLWRSNLREEFIKKFNYDILAFIPHLFFNLGDITPKIRLDLADIKTQIIEDSYFKPIYKFHASRGMIYGCDQSSRGKEPDEFGDYFRTVRWFTAPGNDTPGRAADLIKVKVNSSIAHLYKRPRVWLEGYHSSGWGTTLESITAPTSDNFMFGANLLNLHGLYYSTNGGFFEWAPPDFHFRMPYWDDEKYWLLKYKRLASLLTHGTHLCDTAVFYPVSSFDYGENCEDCKNATFETAENLFSHAVDFDFIDFQSVDNAICSNGLLKVADEKYKVLIFCNLDCIRYSNIRKIKEFLDCGGVVIFFKSVPFASDRKGLNDEVLTNDLLDITSHPNCKIATDFNEILSFISSKIQRSFIPENPFSDKKVYVTRRTFKNSDLFFVRYAEKDSVCRFAAKGFAYLLDTYTEKIYKLDGTVFNNGFTYIKMPNDASQDTVILFTEENVNFDGIINTSAFSTSNAVKTIALDNEWKFSLVPTLDNQYGDYYLPKGGIISAQARFIDCTAVDSVCTVPNNFTYTSLPFCHSQNIRIIRSKNKTKQLCEFIAKNTALVSQPDITYENEIYKCEISPLHDRYGFIYQGNHSDTILCEQGFHGLKGKIFDDNFCFDENTVFITDIFSDDICNAFIISDGATPDFLYVNGEKTDIYAKQVQLKKGTNTLVAGFLFDKNRVECLRNNGIVKRSTLLFAKTENPKKNEYPLTKNDFANPDYFRFIQTGCHSNIFCYKFKSVPSFSGFEISIFGKLIKALSDNTEMEISLVGKSNFGANKFKALLPSSTPHISEVVFFVEAEKGFCYNGVIPEPVNLFYNNNGLIELGDTSKMGALTNYSGKMVYEKTVILDNFDNQKKYTLSLGDIGATAKVEINGMCAAVFTFPPYTTDISKYLNANENNIKITVSNTLCNHYATIPSRYSNFPEDAKSGLWGPVTIKVE